MNVLICIPTYNEVENLPTVVSGVRAAMPETDILIVDDESPDGTGQLADSIAAADPHVAVLHREAKGGLAGAYLAAFGYGLQRGYSHLVEMDADGSHSPQDLSRLVMAADGHRIGLVIGSRYVPGGQTIGWPARRKALSRAGNAYVRLVTGMPLRDATGGFRVYAANALRSVGLDDIQSRGYSFQVEMAWRVSRVGWRTLEVPITFRERVAGESKMNRDVVAEALWRTTKWGLTRRDARLRARERVLDLVERADFAGSPV